MRRILLSIILLLFPMSLAAQISRVSNKNQSLTVNAGAAQTITLPDSATLNGSVIPRPGTLATSINWTVAFGPGVVSFNPSNTASTVATFGNAGVYTLRLNAKTAKLSTYSSVTVTVNPATVIQPIKINNLAWDAVAPLPDIPVSGYNVYRTDGSCDDLSTFQKRNSQLITTNSYSDDPSSAAAWCYFVRAVNSGGESSASVIWLPGESPASNVIWVPTK